MKCRSWDLLTDNLLYHFGELSKFLHSRRVEASHGTGMLSEKKTILKPVQKDIKFVNKLLQFFLSLAGIYLNMQL